MFEDIFIEVVSSYPEKISLENSEIFDSGGARIPALVEAHDKVEDIFVKKSHEHSAMDWSIFQALHAKAKKCIASNENVLYTKSLDVSDVKDRYSENMESIIKSLANDGA